MTRAAQGRTGQLVGPLKEKTIHAQMTRQRIHAIVGQVIDELESRRAKGKSDYVAKLADEIETGGLAAWKSLRDLLPADEPAPGGGAQFNFGPVFVAAAKAASERLAPVSIASTALAIIDVPAEPVQAQPEIFEAIKDKDKTLETTTDHDAVEW